MEAAKRSRRRRISVYLVVYAGKVTPCRHLICQVILESLPVDGRRVAGSSGSLKRSQSDGHCRRVTSPSR